MEGYSPLINSDLEQMLVSGVVVNLQQHGFIVPFGKDIVYPYFVLSLCLSGTARALYDQKEITTEANVLTLYLPGHVLKPLSYSEDYSHAWLLFDPAMFADSELKFTKTDIEMLNQAPLICLTDEQRDNLLTIARVIQYISTQKEDELPEKHRLLETQLTLAYELYTSIRRQYDKVWEKNHRGLLYMRFCELVANHFKEERNVNFYAAQLGYDPRYFTKIFRDFNNGVPPLEWIQEYICTHAKKIMDLYPKKTTKALSIELGFPSTANFCRYFKRTTGMTPMEYKAQKTQ